MKKCILLLALLCGMVGCARTGDESAALPDIIETGENRLVDTFEPPDTAEVSSESAEPTTEPIAETAGSNERLPLRSDEIDLSQFNVITEYEIDDYIYMLADKWSAELKDFIGEDDNTIHFCRIGDHVLIDSSSSYEWGSWDHDYVVMSENSFSVLREIYSMGDAKLFIYDGRLYAYDYWWQNGFIHSFYTIYDLDNERMESRYAELYDIGIPEGEPTVISENIIFADFFEVAGDIRSKTDTLFTIRSVENFLSKDPA